MTKIQRDKVTRGETLVHGLSADGGGRQNVLDLNILIGVDISGSISQEQFRQFMRQIDAIRGLSRVRVIETDVTIQAMYDYFSAPKPRIVRLAGGGGTDFTEFFKVARNIKPDAILFLTDGFVGGSPKAPPFPVGWILTSGGVHPYGFGQVIVRLP